MKKETAEKAMQLITLIEEMKGIKDTLSAIPVCITVMPRGAYGQQRNITNVAVLTFLREKVELHVIDEIGYLQGKLDMLNDETVEEL